MPERLPGIFEISIEERPGSINVIQLFLIRGGAGQRNLLIDAGYSSRWSVDRLLEALEEMEIPMDSLDVFLTHKHADHCGAAHALQTRGAAIYMNREEDRHQYDCLYYRQDHSNEKAQLRVLTRSGITPELAPLIWAKYMEVNQHLDNEETIWKMTMEEYTYSDIRPGMLFAYGDFRLEAISLRGHTYGQMGLIDREKKLLFAADQVLNRTTPIVGTSHADEHLLRCYLDSVDELTETYEDYTILPAHEGAISDLAAVSERIHGAYRKKIGQTLAAVRQEEQTVWQIAKQVYGLTPAKRSDQAFYNAKLITTKTFSMLEYLYDLGEIQRREENGTLFWKK